MFCPHCGKEIPDGVGFCPACGTALAGTQAPAQVDTMAKNGTSSDPADGSPVDPSSAAAASDAASAVHGEAPADASGAFNMPTDTGMPDVDGSGASDRSQPGATQSNAPRQPKKKRTLLVAGIAAAVLVVAIAIGAVWWVTTGSTLGVNEDSFKEAFAESDIVKNGFAAADFVEPSAYQVTAFSVAEPERVEDATLTSGSATIENDNFSTQMNFTASYTSEDGYQFSVTSHATTPTTGITVDNENGLGTVESKLTSGDTCEVTREGDADTWFADITYTDVYTYRFKDDAWMFWDSERTNGEDEVTDAIVGSYKVSSSDADWGLTSLSIDSFDPATGKMQISYAAANASGTLTATLAVNEGDPDHDQGVMENMNQYTFHGEGDDDVTLDGIFLATDGTIQIKAWLPNKAELTGAMADATGTDSLTVHDTATCTCVKQ